MSEPEPTEPNTEFFEALLASEPPGPLASDPFVEYQRRELREGMKYGFWTQRPFRVLPEDFEAQWEALRAEHPWFAERPCVPPDPQGWFGDGNARLLRKTIDWLCPRLILELGSWLGASTRWLLEAAPNDYVIAVDTWAGSPELLADPRYAAKIPTLFATFQHNLWRYRDRLTAVRADTVAGMERLAELGLPPDLIYVDAAHETDAVLRDLEAARRLSPRALLIGDDWLKGSVRVAVEAFAAEHDLTIETDENCWRLL